MKLKWVLNIKFFYKVFAFLVVIVLMCSLTISLLLYFRFNITMSKQNIDFIRYSSEQIKSNVLNLMNNYETIAENIYTDTNIQTFLRNDLNGNIDYPTFEKFNLINNSFTAIRNNNKKISEICLYKTNSKLISDGKYILDINEFLNPNLMKEALKAKGKNFWTAYFDDKSNSYSIALLRYINVLNPGGVLKIELKEQSFRDLYKSEASEKYILYIIDGNNKIISSNQQSMIGSEVTGPVKDYLTHSPTSTKLRLDKNAYYVYHEKIKDDWSIVVLYNSNEVEREKRSMAYYIFIFTSIFIFIALLCSLYFARGFTSQIDKLLVNIGEIEKGNLNIQPTIGRVSEFHILDKTLCIMAQRIDKLKVDIFKAVEQKKESDMKYLQMQMNPHFLYNLLSAVRWIAFHNKQNKIIFIIDHLSNFYKIALSKGNEIINIEAEISLVESYVALQNLCYNNQINLNVHLDEELSGFKVCKMTLQPFVENSVVHGRVHGKALNISIDIKKIDQNISIRIEDDGAGINDEFKDYIESINTKSMVADSMSYGITNTLARLSLVYGNNIWISVERRNPGTFIELLIHIETEL